MRGQVTVDVGFVFVPGITPADAGTSGRGFACPLTVEDHPRGCGDKHNPIVRSLFRKGSPPRMRGQVSFLCR